MRKILTASLIAVILVISAFAANEYRKHLVSTDSYEECAPKFKTEEVSPGLHKCKVPWIDREFFFDESSV